MVNIVFFSNLSRYTERFVDKLDLPGEVIRIPIKGEYEGTIDEPYVLITPTYGSKTGVPHQVIKFLRKQENRKQMVGVIASGNTNFGNDYAKAGHTINKMLKVPLLYTFELLGTREDVDNIEKGLRNYVIQHNN